jgi:membrane protein DedA with SNARE-associated domain
MTMLNVYLIALALGTALGLCIAYWWRRIARKPRRSKTIKIRLDIYHHEVKKVEKQTAP